MASMQDAAFYCIPEEKLSLSRLHAYCGLCLGSSMLGLAGSAWQIHQWKSQLRGFRYRRKPSINPVVVFSLALANLLVSLGVMGRAIAMLCTPPPETVSDGDATWWVPLHGRLGPVVLGTVLEAIGQYLYGVTFMWTIMYAIDIYMELSYRDVEEKWYHLVSWSVPGLTTLGSVLAISLGGALPNRCPAGRLLILHYFFYYILILAPTIICPALYCLTTRLVRLRVRESGLLNCHSRALMRTLHRKFLAIVFLFTICWFPNLVDGIVHMVMAGLDTPPGDAARYFPLWMLEALLNPLQGLLMCLVYGRHVLTASSLRSGSMRGETTPILYRSGKYT